MGPLIRGLPPADLRCVLLSLPVRLSARAITAWLLALLLVPSAWFVGRNADLPRFGDFHDDGIYYVCAKSLAMGQYRIESLPGAPPQTKYPPLYPLLLSLAWRMDPSFPQNLGIAAWITWLALPALLALLAVYYPRMGFSAGRSRLLLVLVALNPYIVLFSTRLLSELWFTAALIGVLLLVERGARRGAAPAWVLGAGLLGGAAYLTRTAGIVLLLSAPAYLWLRRERAKAAWFAAAMLPAIGGWAAWVRLHRTPTADPALIYYLDYVRYQFYNVNLQNLPVVVWRNLDEVVWGLGSLVLPKIIGSAVLKVFTYVIAAAMASGVIRMLRAGRAIHYSMFAAISILMLAVWHYPPNERFVLPLSALAFAGLLTEMEYLAGAIRQAIRESKDRGSRVAAAVMAGCAIVASAGCAGLQAYVGLSMMPRSAAEQRFERLEYRATYAWIRNSLAGDAVVIADNDPVLYLYTGRRSICRPVPPYMWYAEDRAGPIGLYRELGGYAREHNAGYLFHSSRDGLRDLDEKTMRQVDRAIRANPDFLPIHQQRNSTVYRINPASSAPPARVDSAFR